MTRDNLKGLGASSVLTDVTVFNTILLTGGITVYNPNSLGIDFSKIFLPFDFGTCSVVDYMMKNLSIGDMMPTWQKEMSAVKPGCAIASFGDLIAQGVGDQLSVGPQLHARREHC